MSVLSAWLALLAVAGVALGGVGLGLYDRAVPRWTTIYRSGEGRGS